MDIDFEILFILKSAQKFVVLQIFEELMRHSEVPDEFQKMVRPPVLGVEIQCSPTAGAFHLG